MIWKKTEYSVESHHSSQVKKIDTINETDKPQAYQSKKDKSISNESNKCMSLDKSRASQSPEIEGTSKTLNKSRSILSASLSDKSINIEQTKERNVRSDSPGISSMSRPGASIMTVSPDK